MLFLDVLPYDIVLEHERITMNKRISIFINALAIVSSINRSFLPLRGLDIRLL